MHAAPLDSFDDDAPAQLKLVTENFLVSISGGGGAAAFEAALAHKLADLATRGSHCVILERTFVSCHYVQALLTPVGTHVEAVGATYLEADGHQLTDAQRARLQQHGWQPPLEEEEDTPENWWFELPSPNHHRTAARWLLQTLVEAYGLAENEPVAVQIFPADAQQWAWVDEPDAPGGGYIDSDE